MMNHMNKEYVFAMCSVRCGGVGERKKKEVIDEVASGH